LVTVLFMHLNASLSGEVTPVGDLPYDPWVDINDDGIIDVVDATQIGLRWQAVKTTQINKTEVLLEILSLITSGGVCPIATNHLTAVLWESWMDSGTIPSSIIRISKYVTNIGGKSVTFVGGDLSGGTTYSSYDNTYGYFEGAEYPGVGRVEVYDSTNALLAEFALPLNTMFALEKSYGGTLVNLINNRNTLEFECGGREGNG